ncbi:enoyl-CoA hydratase/isomerase family protein [Virgibacillus pantothenticus]|uniref:3-hydroxyisobutyryl-CoA hydrolase n=1 Tax=Virgibacillus pantothenticus TaxID=1473 RepID=A0A0L0QTG8_VIRPA|nr:enoyl-CoA hydratase/isomerase family protein [Virgibacillus pantothenticus]KNE21871.1 3-hydroxyisobutyryl-CoA hydrolase [Virgibacillus pantothenticus]MED3738050.1 enoyl-CoA hydratase/isomerase family protein [Virgibacillus pantothenticus]QTY17115.1 enoyl-CoA hydratase/isomerase family protein [Virgibacillus pantothenticus]SIS90757.1 Enoyl-CoA hydratase/isomerase [Virgibacillus pantothenticus]
MSEVLLSKPEQGIATITLNRPKAINSLTIDMLLPIHDALLAWEKDPDVRIVILKGEGQKGFCAGGDIKTLYHAKENHEAFEKAMEFFRIEYATDKLVANFPKPIIALLDGVVMGGGVGLSYGASHRIITEKTKWAMPEMNISFFPDVGAAYFLNQAPGYAGRYLALTSNIITAEDILFANAGDYYVTETQLQHLIEAIHAVNWLQETDVESKLTQLIQIVESTPEGKSLLSNNQEQIDRHFAFQTIEEIIDSLNSDSDPFAVETKDTILSKSPISLKVTLEQLIRGENKSLAACLETDLIIAQNFLKTNDFYEGVRSVVIDKDRQPVYQYKQLSDITHSLVESFFQVEEG